jgi:tetratricopeptide (TPR) repeat protein
MCWRLPEVAAQHVIVLLRSKLMRASLVCITSLAACALCGDFALAQADADGVGVAPGAGETITVDPPLPSLPWAIPGFDRDWSLGEPSEGIDKAKPAPQKPTDSSASGTAPPGKPAHKPSGGSEQESAAARAEELKKALEPKPPPESVRRQVLNALFERLREARDPQDAQRIAEAITHLWLQSGSDTADLIMQRAMAAAQAGQYPVAFSLFDKLVALAPDWAEAWNQRAAARFSSGDTDGAMADINKAIKLEPRHFGALEGMGMILQEEGLTKSALEIFKKALGIYPLAPDLQNLTEKLTHEVEGEDI